MNELPIFNLKPLKQAIDDCYRVIWIIEERMNAADYDNRLHSADMKELGAMHALKATFEDSYEDALLLALEPTPEEGEA